MEGHHIWFFSAMDLATSRTLGLWNRPFKHSVSKHALSAYYMQAPEIQREMTQTQLPSSYLAWWRRRTSENKCCVVHAADVGTRGTLWQDVMGWGSLTLPVCRNKKIIPSFSVHAGKHQCCDFRSGFGVLKLKFLWWVIRDRRSVSLGKKTAV